MSDNNLFKLMGSICRGELTVLTAKSDIGKSYLNCPYFSNIISRNEKIFFRGNGE